MIHYYTTWAVGAMNGYTKPENGLPTGYKYGTIAVASGWQCIRSLSKLPKDLSASLFLAGLVAIPIAVGSIFCLGNYMGKSSRFTFDVYNNNKHLGNSIQSLQRPNTM